MKIFFRDQLAAGAVCAEMEIIYLKFCAFWGQDQ